MDVCASLSHMQAEAGVALADGGGGEATEGGTASGGGQEPPS